jgi:hypothetical protein
MDETDETAFDRPEDVRRTPRVPPGPRVPHPLLQFVEDQTAPDSFHYVGAGAKVGQADRIVCWFITRATAEHRAVFGDLSIRDVTSSELPLHLERSP